VTINNLEISKVHIFYKRDSNKNLWLVKHLYILKKLNFIGN